MEHLIGDTVDIIEWTNFGYYYLFQYWDNQISSGNPKICICLGVLHRVGSDLSYWILTDNVTVITRTMVKHVIRYEVATNDYQRHTIRFHDNLDIRLGQGNHYAVDLDGLDYFVNDNVPNLFEEK